MDLGREVDLIRIANVLKDPNSDERLKRVAVRTRTKIIRQLHDRKLNHMRDRLMRASYANDEWAMWQMTNQIKDYLGEERIEWWSTKRERV